MYITDKRRERSYYHLSCSLIPLIWFLLILFFPKRSLSHGNEDSVQLLGYDAHYSEGVNTSNDENHALILENDSSSIIHNTSNGKDEEISSSCQAMSRLPEVIVIMLYSCPLRCAAADYGEMNTDPVKETRNGITFEEFRNLIRVEKDERIPSELLNVTRRFESGNVKESHVFPKKQLMEVRVPDVVAEVRQKHLNGVPEDTVKKILMQKVRSLEQNLSVLEQNIKELNKRQGDTFPELDKELANLSTLLTKSLYEEKNLLNWKAVVDKDLESLGSVKEIVSSRLDDLAVESLKLRLDVDRVAKDQANLQTKEIAVIAVIFVFLFVSMVKLVFSCGHQINVIRWVFVLCFSSFTMLVSLL